MDFMHLLTNIVIKYIIWGILCTNCFGEGYFVVLSHNGPVVLGASITFRAELFNAHGQSPVGTFRFRWKDNAIPQHYNETEGHDTVSYWNVTFSKDKYAPGPYEAEVDVAGRNFFFWPIISQRINFNVTALLNGDMVMTQSNKVRKGEFVSSTEQVSHEVSLLPADSNYLSTKATSVLSYWFIDCIYYGQTPGLVFNFNYTDVGNTHHVEALVIASEEPPTTTTTTTSTTTTTTTTTPATTTTTTTTTTTKATTTSTTAFTSTTVSTTPKTPITTTSPTSSPHNVTSAPSIASSVVFTTSSPSNASRNQSSQISSNDIANILRMFPLTKNVTALPVLSPAVTIKNTSVNVNTKLNNIPIGLPYVCLNSSMIPPDPKKTYGYFHRKVTVAAPVTNVVVSGNFWLQHGEMMHLQVSCHGSPRFGHCFMIIPGIRNATGNETCPETKPNVDCEFEVVHYFRKAEEYSVFVIINNDVSRVVTPVGIHVYDVTKHAQLSVIVVPVSCSLIAVILIVFGVAYYVQSKNRYTVEVADFDFGQANDMEYKTFKERLKESMANAVNRSDFADAGGSTWSPSRKYGQMRQD